MAASRPLPTPLPGHDLAYPEIHQACADAGVPLQDRYGFALTHDRIQQAVKAARSGRSILAGADALGDEMWIHGLELCPDAYDEPADDEQLLTIAKVLRSPVGDAAVS